VFVDIRTMSLALFFLLVAGCKCAVAVTFPIQGSVASRNGPPIAAASVTLKSVNGSEVAKTTSAADGKFDFEDIPAGSYQLVITAAGYTTTTTPVTYDGIHPQIAAVALTATGTVSLSTIGTATATVQGGLNISNAPSLSIPNQAFTTTGSFEVDQLLESLPGVTIQKTEGSPAGGESLLNIRGVGSSDDLEGPEGVGAADEVLVLQDGEPLISGNFGSYDLASLTSAIYSRVELIQGTGGTVLYGTPTIGGVLNLVTRNPLPSEGGEVTVSAGNNGLTDFNLFYSNTIGRFGYLIDLHRYGTSGYLPRNYVASVVPIGGSPPGDPYLLLGGFNAKSALFKLSYNFSPVTKITLGQSTEYDYRDITGSLVEPYFTSTGQIQTNPANNLPIVFAYAGNNAGNINHNQPKETVDLTSSILGGNLDVRWYTQVLKQDVIGIDEPGQPPGNYYDQSNYDRLGGLLTGWTRVLGPNTLTLSATANSDYSLVQTIQASGTPLTTTLNAFSTLIQRTYVARDEFRAGKLDLTGALFYSNYDTLNLRRGDGRFGAVYQPTPNSVARFSVGTGFAPPLVTDLTTPVSFNPESADSPPQCPPTNINCAAVEGNPNSRSESGFGLDVGYDWKFGRGGLISADFYRTTVIGHLYEALTTAAPGLVFTNGEPVLYIIEPLNLGDARYEGFELSGTAPLGKSLFLDGNYNTEVAAPFGVDPGSENFLQNIVNGVQIEGVPLHKFGATLRYANAAGVGAFFKWHFTGVNNQYGQPGFSLYDVGTTVPLGRQSTNGRTNLIVSVNNIFNTKSQYYQSTFGIPYPGYSGPYAVEQYGVAPVQLTITVQRKFGAEP
jgi:outer membrane receptor protein involved in Fe transport